MGQRVVAGNCRLPSRLQAGWMLGCLLATSLLMPAQAGGAVIGQEAAVPAAVSAQVPAVEIPSVLLLAIDTLRGDHLHCAGLDWLATPSIDGLARDGVYFRNCLATTSWTLPSFASIFTGLLPYRHGAIGGEFERLPREQQTLAEILAAAGYATAGQVAIHWLTERFGMDQGLESVNLAHRGKSIDAQAAAITRGGLAFAAEHRTSPFFLLLHYYDVHSPYEQPGPFHHLYYEGDPLAPGEPVLTFLKSPENRARGRRAQYYKWLRNVTDLGYPPRAYAAGVTFVDSEVGKVLAGLREMGLYDRMLIVLVSDHGEHLGEHDIYFTHHFLYQEVLNVPLIIKLPGNRHAGTIIERPVSTLDIVPTVLAELSLPVPDGLDGLDLGVLWRRRSGPPRVFASEWGATTVGYAKALVDWPWKLLMFDEDGQARYELYHLSSDPGELNDLAARYGRVVAGLRERLWELFPPEQPLLAEEVARPVELDVETEQQLRALGY